MADLDRLFASLPWGMGDTLNARAFLVEYCRQKMISPRKVAISCGKHAWMFSGLGFWLVSGDGFFPRGKMHVYRNFGRFNIPRLFYDPHLDRCLAKNAGIDFSFDTIVPLPRYKLPDGIKLPDKYITINTGVGPRFLPSGSNSLCLKMWPKACWEEFVRVIGVPCVQIGGGPNCFPVDGAVLDLRDRLTITESAEVMRRGLFHVDLEGGLPILNQHLGKKSVVLFGPTHPDQQGRSFNLNIRDTGCEACYEWGSKKHNNLYIPRSQADCGAHCMTDIYPLRVAERICDAGWLDRGR